MYANGRFWMADRSPDGLKWWKVKGRVVFGVGRVKSLFGYRREIRVGGYV